MQPCVVFIVVCSGLYEQKSNLEKTMKAELEENKKSKDGNFSRVIF